MENRNVMILLNMILFDYIFPVKIKKEIGVVTYVTLEESDSHS